MAGLNSTFGSKGLAYPVSIIIEKSCGCCIMLYLLAMEAVYRNYLGYCVLLHFSARIPESITYAYWNALTNFSWHRWIPLYIGKQRGTWPLFRKNGSFVLFGRGTVLGVNWDYRLVSLVSSCILSKLLKPIVLFRLTSGAILVDCLLLCLMGPRCVLESDNWV